MKKNSCQLSGLRIKKKIILLTSYFLLLITVLIGCAKREITNIDSKGKNIICFGDSITFGYGAESGEDYPTALAKLTEIPVMNAGIDGDTTIEAIRRLKTDVLDRNPLLVLVEFSGNDFLRRIPREVTVKNVREMVESIQEKGAMVAIVDISAGPLLKEYQKEFRILAREKQAIFIPHILNGIITNPNLKSDFIHPNGDGYKAIAEKIFRIIQPYLDQNRKLRRE